MAVRSKNAMKIITSMSRFRFEELRQGILDGTLAAKWLPLEGHEDSLTKSQRVESRQVMALVNLWEQSPAAIKRLVTESWREFRIVERGGLVFAEIVKVRNRQ